jgi:hypothetical protein
MANTDYPLADVLLDETGAKDATEENRCELAALLDEISAEAPAPR